jgi:class 3 adenylate cyclase
MSWPILSGLVILLIGACLMLISARKSNRKLHAELGAAYDSAEALQQSFTRFAPWQLVDELAEGGIIPEAAERKITVLFMDICNFTRLCEPLTPSATITLLNRYYEMVSDAVGKNRGHVSKYIGDGVLAVFGALDNNPWQTDDAVHAALSIVENGRNMDVSDVGAAGGLKICAGIHTGSAVAGVTGSGDLLEFTVLGTTVNLAARVETLTRELGVDILVTEDVRNKLDPGFVTDAQPPLPVKGISLPIRTFSVLGYSGKRVAS